ncbi:MAG: acetyl-CoA C-acetyltransferase [Bacillaceae bacterium]|nr:acetyl-CoA C-acetyltransferase [Bacillaceae bacterium]
MEDVYILQGARTPFATFGGALKDVDPTELGAISSSEAVKRSELEPKEIDQVVIGNVIHATKNASYLARHIALRAGIPEETPALTVNRLCGSGLQAAVSAAQAIKLGESQAALAGGSENMSMSPHVLRQTRFGSKMGAPQIDDMLLATLTDAHCGCGMGITAENLAEKYSISRQEQDQFALESQKKAAAAQEEGIFAEEIVPITVKTRKGEIEVSQDEHLRPETTLEGLSQLKPAFKKDGTVTAGNSSGINDGAAAVVLAGESFIQRKNLNPLARIVSWGVAGVDPRIMGIGPVPASQMALERAGISIDDIDLVEVNEAFAAQYLAVEKELGLDRSRVNLYGGAIALGHPVGASGARLLYSMALSLKRNKKKYGLVSLCIGGGQGISMVIESV